MGVLYLFFKESQELFFINFTMPKLQYSILHDFSAILLISKDVLFHVFERETPTSLV